MNLALVGWASETGVGMELRDASKYLPVSETFYLEHPGRPTLQAPVNLVSGGNPVREMETFIDKYKIDTVLTWETPGDWRFPALFREKKVRWFSVVHWDWFHPGKLLDWKTAHLIAPNGMCQDGLKKRYGLESTLLPVPIDLDRLAFRFRRLGFHFISIYGLGGPHDRRSIQEIMATWELMEHDSPPLQIRAQKAPLELAGCLPKRVELEVKSFQDANELYSKADVAIQLSKYEGVGLSLIEAQATGLPTITLDAEPMRTLAPDLLVSVAETIERENMRGHAIEVAIPDPKSLRTQVMNLWHLDIRELSEKARKRAEGYSWEKWKPEWVKLLEGR